MPPRARRRAGGPRLAPGPGPRPRPCAARAAPRRRSRPCRARPGRLPAARRSEATASTADLVAAAGVVMRAEDEARAEREAMVERQIAARGVRDPVVLAALRAVPREAFLPESLREFAYEDAPLPIDEGQTISQPYIVAYMTQALGLRGGERVLEIGTGSG